MTTAIAGFTPTTPTNATPSTGMSGMSADDFMKVMITQLQQQDPLNPSDSGQLLTQMSQISQLQSNATMTTTLQGVGLQQSIGAGGNLIGKAINGIDDAGNQVTGTVQSVLVQDSSVYLQLDSGKSLPLTSVTQIAEAPTGAAAGTTAAAQPAAMQTLMATPQIQTLLSQLGLSGSSLTAQQLASIISSPQGQQILTAANSGTQAATTSGSGAGSLISGLLGMLGV